ncbi:TPA: hypothetical protein ACYUQH_002592 [Klebsiella pneumoniae]|uniref:hypothetical protein n=1 Tax=Klebsiella pneumoniae TaxID=573 RepID=UPI001C958916|nr:hypothetical protein [Klebsiella pneumoniae]MBY5153857.1 hypothetical protein [Klebsiella pneumoniae]MBZ7543908.1 hypothetical protein [Klebsiella pneumoniae]HBQ5307971.1 hypothetical protein [Klebsiella pneumoniae]HBQ5447791.1 hypothetical protein [Klebsiella pneumoniae]HCA8483580.1 hypothetical protein [Klebsiella pneumoniae]
MARYNRIHSPDLDYVTLLLSGEYTRQHLQTQAALKPESATSKKIREALAIHALIVAAEKLVELRLRNQQSITTTEEEIS